MVRLTRTGGGFGERSLDGGPVPLLERKRGGQGERERAGAIGRLRRRMQDRRDERGVGGAAQPGAQAACEICPGTNELGLCARRVTVTLTVLQHQ